MNYVVEFLVERVESAQALAAKLRSQGDTCNRLPAASAEVFGVNCDDYFLRAVAAMKDANFYRGWVRSIESINWTNVLLGAGLMGALLLFSWICVYLATVAYYRWKYSEYDLPTREPIVCRVLGFSSVGEDLLARVDLGRGVVVDASVPAGVWLTGLALASTSGTRFTPEACLRGSIRTNAPTPQCQVYIYIKDDGNLVPVGTGFRIDDLLVTAAHVLSPVTDREVYLKTETSAAFKLDPAFKLALRGVGMDFVAVSLPLAYWAGLQVKKGRMARPQTDERIRVVGRTPSGGAQMSSGSIKEGLAKFQFLHSASTLPGDSGAPLMNSREEVVGIHLGSQADKNLNKALSVVPLMDSFYSKESNVAGSRDLHSARFEDYEEDDYAADYDPAERHEDDNVVYIIDRRAESAKSRAYRAMAQAYSQRSSLEHHTSMLNDPNSWANMMDEDGDLDSLEAAPRYFRGESGFSIAADSPPPPSPPPEATATFKRHSPSEERVLTVTPPAGPAPPPSPELLASAVEDVPPPQSKSARKRSKAKERMRTQLESALSTGSDFETEHETQGVLSGASCAPSHTPNSSPKKTLRASSKSPDRRKASSSSESAPAPLRDSKNPSPRKPRAPSQSFGPAAWHNDREQVKALMEQAREIALRSSKKTGLKPAQQSLELANSYELLTAIAQQSSRWRDALSRSHGADLVDARVAFQKRYPKRAKGGASATPSKNSSSH
jgi:hypothetical protein